MKKILAISGGVDSMVMLNLMKDDPDVVVAHFNHGTRESANDDESFVRRITEEYRIPLEVGRASLGENVSEAVARTARYDFLRTIAEKYDGVIFTAHHLDDLVESVVINLVRGTGWRGLAALGAKGIIRPFLEPDFLDRHLNNYDTNSDEFRGDNKKRYEAPFDKRKIWQYAAEKGIKFRQDPTNTEENYLRNRLRPMVRDFAQKKRIWELWRAQSKLRAEIEEEIAKLDIGVDRKKIQDLPEVVALEYLRGLLQKEGISVTRPQLRDFWQAVCEYVPGKYFNLPGDRLVKINKNDFVI